MGDIWRGEREMGARPSRGTAELRDKNGSSCQAHVWSHDRWVNLMLSPPETYALLLSYTPLPHLHALSKASAARCGEETSVPLQQPRGAADPAAEGAPNLLSWTWTWPVQESRVSCYETTFLPPSSSPLRCPEQTTAP